LHQCSPAWRWAATASPATIGAECCFVVECAQASSWLPGWWQSSGHRRVADLYGAGWGTVRRRIGRDDRVELVEASAHGGGGRPHPAWPDSTPGWCARCDVARWRPRRSGPGRGRPRGQAWATPVPGWWRPHAGARAGQLRHPGRWGFGARLLREGAGATTSCRPPWSTSSPDPHIEVVSRFMRDATSRRTLRRIGAITAPATTRLLDAWRRSQ
jgi:hypothetical protein